jgi:hypothetical protein
LTKNVSIVYEDTLYSIDYNASDIDGEKNFQWSLNTNASWLSINKNSGLLSGTPRNADVGISYVNITVKDPRGGTSSQNFTIKVINVNDPPIWVDVPKDFTVEELGEFYFDVNATDIDVGDILEYNMSTISGINITINPETGFIEGSAIVTDRESSSYVFEITLWVTDGEVRIWTSFEIKVIPNSAPSVSLISPQDNTLVHTRGTELIWAGSDEENDLISYTLYLSKNVLSVSNNLAVARVATVQNQTSHTAENLETGITYYWTVIPHDGLQAGICLDDLFVWDHGPIICNTSFQIFG